MKSKKISLPAMEKYGLIEALESRIAPAAATTGGFLDHAVQITAAAGGAIKVSAGEVLTQGSTYLLYVEQGEVLVHTTDFNNNGALDFNEITGLSVGAGTRVDVFVDIHGDVVTNLKPDFTLTDSDNNGANGRDGRILLDANIDMIDMRSLQASDFSPVGSETSSDIVNDHLALSSYSIFGNIYAGGGLGTASDIAAGKTTGLIINTVGSALQQAAPKFTPGTGSNFYAAAQPVIGGVYVGTAASGQRFDFGTDGTSAVVSGTLLPFTPAPAEIGAGVYNISSNSAFNIGSIEAGNGGFNAAGGSLVNIALQGETGGGYSLIAGNAGAGTTGHAGGSILNFSDPGTMTGQVLLQSGNGGAALIGAGGNAGAITFNTSAPIGISAHFVLNYGNGGDGYSAGGNGSSITAANFVTPSGTGVTNANIFVSTMHTIGSIGTTAPFDFNGDGNSDAVFSTVNPNQLEVAFGDGFGFDPTKTIYLSGPPNVSSIVVGDFTGNGHPDIAVASSAANYGGIEVFFSQYNQTGQFTGFSAPEFVTLPDLADQGLAYTSVPVFKMATGDFTGSGHLDLAVVAQEITTGLLQEATTLIYLTNDGQGHFLADFKHPNLNPPDLVLGKSDPSQVLLHPTALATYTPGNGHDVLIQSGVGAKGANVIDYSGGNGPVSTPAIGFGKVDTNRTPSTNTDSLTDFTVQDFAITQDPTTPANADIVALSATPVGFLVTEQGNGSGMFTTTSGNGNQAGFAIATSSHPVGIVAIPNTGATAYSDVAILDYGTANSDSIYGVNIAVLATPPPKGTPVGATESATVSASATEHWLPITPGGQNNAFVAWDRYDPQISTPPAPFGFVEAEPLTSVNTGSQLFSVLPPGGGAAGDILYFQNDGYFITSGNGGNALDGHGGAGGSIGQTLTTSTSSSGVVTATGSLNIVYPSQISFEGETILTAGNGGNGFSGGGAGGFVYGLSVKYATGTGELTGFVELQAGNGGQSLTGAGGAGGNVGQTDIQTGENFFAGNGGIGKIGGAGGTVFGTNISGLTAIQANATNGFVFAYGGTGATGITQGGNGGSVSGFQVLFPPLIGGAFGELQYVGGAAGNAVDGQGGTGGSIVNSSPINTTSSNGADNNLAGDILLQGGNGGNGLYGGGGGAITNFTDKPSIIETPTSLTVIAGTGGNATAGTGGAGGGITNFSSPSVGDGFTNFNGLLVHSSYDRLVAGAGGSSLGGAGGAGGGVSNVNSTASGANAQFFLAAGAGGQGLTAGGAGGNVLSATLNAGSNTGKVVVVAGDGGASLSGAPLANTPAAVAMAIGAVNGPGGHGGSIENFVQPGSIATHVDLIAGNGGSTLGHSEANTFAATGQSIPDNAGAGGSILGVSVAGDIGNIDPTVAIKSYNDFFGGQTMQQFIDTTVLGAGFSDHLTDATGNVGLVAGVAGSVLGGLPSETGVNGSVNNISARDIMSMVAGSVDQVNFIQNLTNYGSYLSSGAILGAAKSVPNGDIPASTNSMPNQNYVIPNALNYINAEGIHSDTPLPGGGILIDGAFVAKNVRTTKSERDFQGTG